MTKAVSSVSKQGHLQLCHSKAKLLNTQLLIGLLYKLNTNDDKL